MKIFKIEILIISLSLLISSSIYSQKLSDLLKEDFNKREQLLIQNEVRKKLGSRANQKDVTNLISDLLPWAVMEGQDSKTFARTIVLFTRNLDAGIELNESEELIPLLNNYSGSDDDFVYLSKFYQEANLANLPIEVRDSYIRKSRNIKFDGLSTWIGGRILIFGLSEKLSYQNLFTRILKLLPNNLHRNSEAKNMKIFSEIMRDFTESKRNSYLTILLNQIRNVEAKSGRNLTLALTKKDRNLENNFEEIGKMDLTLRPKIELSPEDLGIDIESTIDQTETKPESINNNLPTNWRFLIRQNLKQVVSGWIGTKYVYGGGSKVGTDCSGFTIGVLTDPLISVPRSELPRSARHQALVGTEITRSNIREGDLVFFSASKNQTKITHVGLAMGGGQFSHASSSRGVVIQGLSERWWLDRFVTSRRIFSKVEN
ncbi:MAG: C40 family peptidase [Leptospiraceae bacterium]|nr:C40 family peptidase [Leptospiraceae bacterium]MCZ8345083.1 C40 family peptidase [Leptospiraceae bacterium]